VLAVGCIWGQVEVAVVAVAQKEAVARLAPVQEAVRLAYRMLKDGRASMDRDNRLRHLSSNVLGATRLVDRDANRVLAKTDLAR
jgi:hypothetical protein